MINIVIRRLNKISFSMNLLIALLFYFEKNRAESIIYALKNAKAPEDANAYYYAGIASFIGIVAIVAVALYFVLIAMFILALLFHFARSTTVYIIIINMFFVLHSLAYLKIGIEGGNVLHFIGYIPLLILASINFLIQIKRNVLLQERREMKRAKKSFIQIVGF